MITAMIRQCLCALLCVLAVRPAMAGVVEQARSSGVQGGIIVHLGCGDGTETVRLLRDNRFLVHGLDASGANIQLARKHIQAAGVDERVSVAGFDGVHLPYVDRLVNLVIDSTGGTVPEREIMRVLVPRGVAFLGDRKIVKPPSPELDDWSHFLHGPDNNAVARDRTVGIPRSIQWVARPRWGRTHEEMAGMSSAVTAGGRLYYIVDEGPLASIRYPSRWQLIARDAFNGTLLWKRSMVGWVDPLRHFRSGPAHLPRRLVADQDRVFVTLSLDAPVTALDGATGETIRSYAGTERTEEILINGGVLYVLTGTSEINRRGGGLSQRGEPAPARFRRVSAVAANSGKVLWRRDFSDVYILPLTLAVSAGRVFFQTTEGMVCLDAPSGEDRWQTPRPTPAQRMAYSAPTLVATPEVVLCSDRNLVQGAEGRRAKGAVVWGVEGWNLEGFSRRVKNTVIAYDAATGKELWTADGTEGFNSPVDIFVVGDVVWIGAKFSGVDLKTGRPVGQIDLTAPRVGMVHHRCYRDKASERFIFTGKSGIEVLSLEEEKWLSNNSWLRGTCTYGIIPANGLLYAPPDACACFLTVKTPGFFAAAPQRDASPAMPFPDVPRLERGPAFGGSEGSAGSSTAVAVDDWPMYRHDAARSGTTQSPLPDSLPRKWSAAIGGRLTQPVITGDRVFVASIDAHTVHALAAVDGRSIWHFTAGGRIDSAPTVYRGRVYFGAADGWVYCVAAADGELVWRFQAAPQDRLVAAYGQLESIWPVHGSVLIQHGSLYVAAGRSSYLDGGIVLYRLDPATGHQRARTVLSHLDPETGRQLVPEAKFNMEGTTSDVLVGDGDDVYLKYLGFDAELRRLKTTQPHLFSITGLLGEEWYVRSYWIVGSGMPGAGWGGWARAANSFPSGRILSFDQDRVFGYGRSKVAAGPVGHRADAYHLFCTMRSAPTASPAANETTRRRTTRRGKKVPSKAPPVWSHNPSLIVRALVASRDRLAIAGPRDLGEKAPDILAYKNEAEAVAGFEGKKGVYLRLVTTNDGRRIAETDLTAPPVFDGMAAAGGRIYVSQRDGALACFGTGR